MLFDKKDLPRLFRANDYTRGLDYYRRGRVRDLDVFLEPNGGSLECTVKGSANYQVAVSLYGKALSPSCTCPRFRDMGVCKHVAAAMIACADMKERPASSHSDPAAGRILRTYMERMSRQQTLAERPARLLPVLHPIRGEKDYPSFSFLIGFEKLYVVPDVKKWASGKHCR